MLFLFLLQEKKGIIQKCNELVDKEISIDNIIYKLLKLEEIYEKKNSIKSIEDKI